MLTFLRYTSAYILSTVVNYDISAHTLSVYQLIQKCFVVIKVSDNRPNLLDCVGSVDV